MDATHPAESLSQEDGPNTRPPRGGAALSGFPRDEIEDALAALLADPGFHLSARNRSFLKFVVDETLAGRADDIKAYAIATNVLGRSTAFNPSLDSIVRIEATRLRAALRQYYDGPGRQCALQIELPKGRYVPAFVRPARRAKGDTGPAGERTGPLPEGSRARLPKSSSRTAAWIAFALIIAVAATAVARFARTGAPELIEKPLLSVEVLPQITARADATARLHEELIASLMRFERWQIKDRSKPSNPRDGTGARSRYLLSVRIGDEGLDEALWWRLVDERKDEIVRSDRMQVGGSMTDPRTMRETVGRLADWLGGSRGLINALELARPQVAGNLGHGCVVTMEAEFWLWDPTHLPAIKACLEETLRLVPDDPEYMAALSRVLARIARFDGTDAAISKAFDFAARAAARAPHSSQAVWALSVALYRRHDIGAAATVARRAMALNPDDRSLRAYAGLAIFQSGSYDEGSALIRSAESPGTSLNPEAYLVLAFDAYRLSRFREAVARSSQAGELPCFCVSALRAAAFAELGQERQAAAQVEELLASRPSVRSDFSEAMAKRGMPRELTEQIRAGLAKAGLIVK